MSVTKLNYSRRRTSPVRIGSLTIGGNSPIRVQSMTDTSTDDVQASVAQAVRIIEAGGELVRLTTQGERQAHSIGMVREGLRGLGYDTPIVADVHFNRNAAFVAAECCDKVRINPGNFADAARTFKKLEYTEAEYAAELKRIEELFLPFLQVCKEHGTAIRLGINHGSLSDRIMSRYGDSPAGMTQSAMEYLRICRKAGFDDVVISMKSSNPVVMVEAVHSLVEAMDTEEMTYPLHLGVTEAGDGAEARIKSAAGICTLLAQGLGDTVRVSLSEPPEAEIPVARALVDYISSRARSAPVVEYTPRTPAPLRAVAEPVFPGVASFCADALSAADMIQMSAEDDPVLPAVSATPILLTTESANIPGAFMSWIGRFVDAGGRNPIILQVEYDESDLASVQLKAAADLAPVLMAGYASGIRIISGWDMADTELIILQAVRLRFSKTEYIACPGCGRTMFDLQGTLARVRHATSHLPGLKIGVMGCIVNGPGEMADADYGYVGAASGNVSLYRGKECVQKNIPQAQAIDRLIEIIKADGRWVDSPSL